MAKFDESKVINCFHSDRAEIGKRYYRADDLFKLKEVVESKNKEYIGIFVGARENRALPFVFKGNSMGWGLIYPCEDPEYVPYENTDEMIQDFKERCHQYLEPGTEYAETENPMSIPVIWLKKKNTPGLKELVVNIYEKYIEINGYNHIWDMADILDMYTFLDGSPVGKLKK